MLKAKIKYHNYIIAFLIFVSGIFIGKLIRDFPILELDNKIDFADVLNLIVGVVTIFVGLHIAHVLDRRKKKEEYTLEFLIQKINEIKEDSRKLLTALSQGNTPLHQVNNRIKNISMGYSELKSILELVNIPVDDNTNREIIKLWKHIRLLCTEQSVYIFGTNTIAYTNQADIIVSQGDLMSYSSERIDEVKKYSSKIINEIFYIVAK